ncbi:MAG: hypothetical protein ACTSRG_03475 [Candidatus Helarchaeota archaeon]
MQINNIYETLNKMSFSSGVVTTFYGQLVLKLMEKYKDEEKVAEILKLFGRRLIIRFQDYWTPKSEYFSGIIKECYRVIMRRNLRRFTEIEKDKKWLVVDSSCILCGEGGKGGEGGKAFGDLFYCVLMAGIFEGGINHLREKTRFEYLPKVKVETIASKRRGDRFCKHEITVVE